MTEERAMVFVPAKDATYTEGINAVGCPNRKNCGESSLSLRWAIQASKFETRFAGEPRFPLVSCFICNTVLGEMKDADE